MPEKRVTFSITHAEQQLLEEVIVFEPYLQENIERIKKKGEERYITFDAYDLFDAINALEYHRDCIDSYRKKQQIRSFVDKAGKFLKLIVEPGQNLGT